MKIVFLSNFFNHHQKPISDVLDKKGEYLFVATETVPEDRKKLGYSDSFPLYVSQLFSDKKNGEFSKKLIYNADVVVAGSAPESMVRRCIKSKKLVIRYAERPLKKGMEFLKYPMRFIRWHYSNPRNKPIYMLCASAYTAGDYAKFGLFKGKTYKWGYFPETKHYNIEELLVKKDKKTILWCGRLLDWKHPDDVIKVAERLKENGYDFSVKLIGIGPMEEKLKALVLEKGLQREVSFLGSMKPDQVREHMEKAGVYLFTSDHQEGWGAVLNESMNSGCAVVASHTIGAVPFLMKNEENGLIYESGNVDMLFEKVKYLLDHPEEQMRLGNDAYQTIVTEWNAEEAAKRLLNLVEHILKEGGSPRLYHSGPCSEAIAIKESRFLRDCCEESRKKTLKICLLSNFFNHHQEPISKAFDNFSGVDYTFIATEKVPKKRQKLGYIDKSPNYLCKAYMGFKIAKQVLKKTDVVLAGSAPECLVKKCIKSGKLLFRYAERPLKKGFEPLKYLVRFIKWNHRNPKNKPIYMLCASAYTAGDYARFGLFKNRTYKWGYFPETKHYDIDNLINKKDKKKILWCGRFLTLKNPNAAIEVAMYLKNEGYDFSIEMIGIGPLESKLKTIVKKKGLEEYVSFLGAMRPEQVREHMERAGIYLFTSGRQEGWGAVLNEAMNSGCAVVASHEIGSVPFLINDGENGFVYRSGDMTMLCEKVKYLLDHTKEQGNLGKNAYQTIVEEWNAEEAAKRLLQLTKCILNGEKYPQLYQSGPCSKADLICDQWNYE